MKLYEVPENSYIKITDKETKIPICATQVKTGDVIWFGHIDGMYSYCKDKNDNLVHIAACTEVEIVTGEKDDKQAEVI